MTTRVIPVDPFDLVVFGATGDLAQRKLLPALYHRDAAGQILDDARILGVSRRRLSDDAFRALARQAVCGPDADLDADTLTRFLGRLSYTAADAGDDAGWPVLAERLAERPGRVRVFYLATAPELFGPICDRLGRAGLSRNGARVVVEKPIGKSLASARAVNDAVGQHFTEDRVYRIDHYLGKETVQNLMALRFANALFEPLWRAALIDHVQITVAETLGVEGRAGYYDTAGALRDMVQNHMMQLLSLVAMEPPASLEAEDIRDEKVKVLRSIRPIAPAEARQFTLRGQYDRGSIAGKPVAAYREEPNVAPDSRTETFVALKLFLDNWRWAGVPFYLRQGKRLPKQVAEIAIQFKATPAVLFAAEPVAPVQPNVLVLRIQPDEGIAIRMNAKVPGTTLTIQPVKMDFRYGGTFGARSPDAYERLLHDVLVGDATLFTRSDEVECSWAIMDAILDGWSHDQETPPVMYESGTWGPAEADEFIERDGRQWRRP